MTRFGNPAGHAGLLKNLLALASALPELFGRKSKEKLVETGFALGALKIAVSLIRPAIMGLVKKRLTAVAGQASSN
jgi:hypothetical protein